MMGLDGCSSAASRNGAIASAGLPAPSNLVAKASSGSTGCSAAGFKDWDMAFPYGPLHAGGKLTYHRYTQPL